MAMIQSALWWNAYADGRAWKWKAALRSKVKVRRRVKGASNALFPTFAFIVKIDAEKKTHLITTVKRRWRHGALSVR